MYYFWSGLHYCSLRLISQSYENVPNINNIIVPWLAYMCLTLSLCFMTHAGGLRRWEYGRSQRAAWGATWRRRCWSCTATADEWVWSSGTPQAAASSLVLVTTTRYHTGNTWTLRFWNSSSVMMCVIIVHVSIVTYQSAAHTAKAPDQIISFRAPPPT